MLKRMLLAFALICEGGTGAISVRDIPALPLSRSAAVNPAHDLIYPSGYRRSQLEEAREALETLPGLVFMDLDDREGRVQLGLSFKAQQAEAERRLRALSLPPDISTLR